eukprot:gene4618-6496_t
MAINSDDPLIQAYKSAHHSLHCGQHNHWKKEYLQLVQEQSHQDNPRLLIQTVRAGGFNDRLVGVITGFYAALLSKRMYIIRAYGGYIPFEAAFDYSSYNWSANNMQSNIVDIVAAPSVDQDGFPTYDIPEMNSSFRNVNATWINMMQRTPLFSSDTDPKVVDTILSDKTNILFESNRGGTYELFTRSNYSRKITSITGIHEPQFCIYYAFYFLFKPNHHVIHLAKPYSSQLADKNTLKIGIQIRVGDKVWKKNYSPFINSSHYYENFFHCANWIEKNNLSVANGQQKRNVKWYLISDSLSIRQDAKRIYGNKIVTNTNDVARHQRFDPSQIADDFGVGRFGAFISENFRGVGNNIVVQDNLDPSENDYCRPPFGSIDTYDLARRGGGT